MEIKANSSTSEGFKSLNKARNFEIIMDNTPENGGDNLGGTPKEHLCMALGSCTNMTLQAFMKRKDWLFDCISTDTELYHENLQFNINLEIKIKGNFDEDQIKKLGQIAHLCPIHKILSKGCQINTSFRFI